MTSVRGSTAHCLLTGTRPGWRSQGTEGALHGARLKLCQDLAPARGAEAAPCLFEPCRRAGGDEEVLAGGVLRGWCFRLPDIFSLFTPGDGVQREPPWCIKQHREFMSVLHTHCTAALFMPVWGCSRAGHKKKNHPAACCLLGVRRERALLLEIPSSSMAISVLQPLERPKVRDGCVCCARRAVLVWRGCPPPSRALLLHGVSPCHCAAALSPWVPRVGVWVSPKHVSSATATNKQEPKPSRSLFLPQHTAAGGWGTPTLQP